MQFFIYYNKYNDKEIINIMQFIALFLPSLCGCTVFSKMEMTIEGIVRYISNYFNFVLYTNVFTMFIVTYVLGLDGVVSEALESFSFFMIYTVMACFVSVVGAIVGKVLRNNFAKWN